MRPDCSSCIHQPSPMCTRHLLVLIVFPSLTDPALRSVSTLTFRPCSENSPLFLNMLVSFLGPGQVTEGPDIHTLISTNPALRPLSSHANPSPASSFPPLFACTFPAHTRQLIGFSSSLPPTSAMQSSTTERMVSSVMSRGSEVRPEAEGRAKLECGKLLTEGVDMLESARSELCSCAE